MKALAAKIILTPLVIVALLASGTADATPPGQNGRIVFRRYFNDAMSWGAVLSVNPDGTDERRITHPKRKVLDNNPAVSPDGRWVIFSRTWQLREPKGRGALIRIRMNGTDRENLTGNTCRPRKNSCFKDIDPSWSPDGQWISFSRVFRSETREWEMDLFVMRSDGSHLHKITAPGPLFEDWASAWSPDGTRLVFYRYHPDRQLHALFTVDPDGTDLQRVTTWHLNPSQSTDWSPDGQWILFSAGAEGHPLDLRMIRPDGTGLHRITHSRSEDWLGSSFAPNGKRIVAARAGGVGEGGRADVFVMRLDGTHRRNITRSEKWDSAPDWGARKM